MKERKGEGKEWETDKWRSEKVKVRERRLTNEGRKR